MTIIPDKPTTLVARTSADFVQEFEWYDDDAQTVLKDLTGIVFDFVLKTSELADVRWVAKDDIAITIGSVTPRIKVVIEREILAAAMASDQKRQEGVFELQSVDGDGLDGVPVGGPFLMQRGL